MVFTPYTYLIGWSTHGIWYYGVRYAARRNYLLHATGCHPSDLWVTYFTSSRRVKAAREAYGEPDVIQVRKTFSTREAALAWEDKVIRRMNAVRREDFLNLSHTQKKVTSEFGGAAIAAANRRRVVSDTTREKMSISGKGKKLTPEWIEKISAAQRGKSKNPDSVAKMKAAIRPKQTSDHINKRRSSLTGQKRSEETKRIFSEKARNRERITCPHCNKTGQNSAMARWHFDNCKELVS